MVLWNLIHMVNTWDTSSKNRTTSQQSCWWWRKANWRKRNKNDVKFCGDDNCDVASFCQCFHIVISGGQSVSSFVIFRCWTRGQVSWLGPREFVLRRSCWRCCWPNSQIFSSVDTNTVVQNKLLNLHPVSYKIELISFVFYQNHVFIAFNFLLTKVPCVDISIMII